MKKLTALLVSLLLICGMSITVFADGVKISTQVPNFHTVSIEAEGGRVIVDGQICEDSVHIERQKEQAWWIVPERGKVLSALYYNGEDVTAQVKAGVFTAPALVRNATLEAVFTDAPNSSQDEKFDISGTVTDKDGNPVSDATVDIGGRTGTTDEDGNFTVKDVPTGTWLVTVTDQDGKVIGIGEVTIGAPDGRSLTTTRDGNGNPVISPGSSTTAISLTLAIGEEGVISIQNVKDATPAQTEPAKPDNGGSQSGGQGNQSGSPSSKSNVQTSVGASPKTDDIANITLWSVLILASGAGLAGTALCRRKKKYN